VDAGAFDGRTSLSFAKQAAPGRVFAFEPEPANQTRIRKFLANAKSSGDPKAARAADFVELAPYALFSRETTLRFTASKAGSSSITANAAGAIEVPAISLDGFAERKRLKAIDLVSVDVEGAEAEVLAGMRATIEQLRPKLQISIYHARDHLWTLPALVRSLCRDYVYFLGHHNTYSTETDLYAIPEERARQSGALA
jgi:FkbM family methyltransferase